MATRAAQIGAALFRLPIPPHSGWSSAGLFQMNDATKQVAAWLA